MNTDMKQETAVEYMFRLLDVMTFNKDDESQDIFEAIFERAKAMEKEQMTTFAKMWESKIFDGSIDSVDDYYNETYGGDK